MSSVQVACVMGAYLLGSVPFGLIFARSLSGIDPRFEGSGNIGFTNVLRSAGWAAGLLTLIGDMGKGAAAVYLARTLSGDAPVLFASGVGAVVGHNFPVWLRFKGGKGVATGLGVLLAADPWIGLGAVAVWAGVVSATRISSLGAIVSFLLLPVAWWLKEGTEFLWFAVCLCGLILVRHRSNILRLRQGVEPRMGGSSGS